MRTSQRKKIVNFFRKTILIMRNVKNNKRPTKNFALNRTVEGTQLTDCIYLTCQTESAAVSQQLQSWELRYRLAGIVGRAGQLVCRHSAS